jgi:hypothetical protein
MAKKSLHSMQQEEIEASVSDPYSFDTDPDPGPAF